MVNLPKDLKDLEAISPAKSLFIGNIQTECLFPYPDPLAKDRESLNLIIDSIDKFLGGKASEVKAYEKKGAQPDDFIQSLRELGLFGLIIPEENGGLGLTNSGYSRVLQQVTRYDGSTSLTIGAHSSIGLKGLLLFGNEQQKTKYLPKLASGETIAAFCLTESGAGSDAASIKTKAEKQSDGSWILNGEKIWITNGPIADFFTVFAKTESEGGKISAFIVERSFAGVATGPKEEKMGIRASATSTVSFTNVKVPAENLLGEEGKGFKVAMNILNNGRTGLGGGCVGAMKRAISLATAQANQRKQFGKSISEFALIKEKIANMTVAAYVTESLVGLVGHFIDSDVQDYSVEAAISKIVASESLWYVSNEALQIAGGNGFMSEYPYENIVRDSRINLIFEGTNEILRLYVALSGFQYAGDYLKEVTDFFKAPIKGFGIFSDYTSKKISRISPIKRDSFPFLPESLQSYGAVLGAHTLQLSGAVENALKTHKKNIVGQQLLSKRIADITIDLFSGLAVLSRVAKSYKENGDEKSAFEQKILKIFMQNAKRKMNYNLRRIDRNEDNESLALGEEILRRGEFGWDLL